MRVGSRGGVSKEREECSIGCGAREKGMRGSEGGRRLLVWIYGWLVPV